jgi:capsid protein
VLILAPVLARLKLLDDYDDALLFRQGIANMFAGFIRKPVPEEPTIDPITGQPIQTDTDGFTPMVGLEPGSMQELLPGEEVEFSSPPDAGAITRISCASNCRRLRRALACPMK